MEEVLFQHIIINNYSIVQITYIYLTCSPSSTELLMETPTADPEYSIAEVLVTTYSVEKKKKNSISQ